MRVYVLSDLHLEYYGNKPRKLWRALENKLSYFRQDFRLAKPEARKPKAKDEYDDGNEVMCFCGDIGWPLNKDGAPSQRYRELLTMFRARWPRTLLVAGNHEYYSRRGFSLEYVASTLRQLAAEVGVAFLDRDRVEIDGVVFLGCTLWSKTSYRDFAAMNDSRLVFTCHQENRDCHARDVWWLEEQLQSLPADQRVVVLTHHVPTKTLAPVECSTAYASDLEHLVARANLWLCGHVHEPGELLIGKALVVRSAVGGPREKIMPLDKYFLI